MAGTSEGAKQAAKTRKEKDPQAFQKMGEKGGHAAGSSGSTHERAVKAAQTRKEHDPDAFRKMGQKGGSHSHGVTNKKREDDNNR